MEAGAWMGFSELINDGYSFYKRTPFEQYESNELRDLENHLWYMAQMVTDLNCAALGYFIPSSAGQPDVDRIIQWLEMAASLRMAHIDMSDHAPGPYLCKGMSEYYASDSEITSAYATEYTRLLYTWCAVERLLDVLQLPPMPTFDGWKKVKRDSWNNATYHLLRTPVVDHYHCTARHLRQHVQNDPVFAGAPQLLQAFEVTPWRSVSGSLLLAGNRLRNMPAHGDLSIPTPVVGDERIKIKQHLALHAPRLAARGLLMSMQMLLTSLETPDDYWNGNIGPEDGWWMRDDEGVWKGSDDGMHPKYSIAVAHLRPVDAYGVAYDDY
ncbi:hypothetical protein ACFYR1_29070 [Streptomyces canus]|uniref:hypothetical protein n=1 Tax=Streptomyces canus TaxID=58343 RepID=UPI003698E7A5